MVKSIKCKKRKSNAISRVVIKDIASTSKNPAKQIPIKKLYLYGMCEKGF